MNHVRLNAYKIMWLFVFFDLPVVTKKQRKQAQKFRKQLMDFGFSMLQFSVYIRHCASKENMDMHINRVKAIMPMDGHISIVPITDKQYGNIQNFWGVKKTDLANTPKQLELF